MKIPLFITIVLLSGCFAGVIHGTANLVLVEPFLDDAIEIENQNLFESGEEKDTPEFRVNYNSYRDWQKGGQVLAGAILGTSVGALFGIIFAYSKKILPGNNNMKKAIILAGVMWLTIYFIPFLKYPANPPTVGDPETIVLRSVLYLSFIAISGLGALGFYKISRRMQSKQKLVGIVGYALFITVVFLAMPQNPDEITAPMNLINGFRIMSVLAVSVYWVSLGLIFGVFWQKLNPDLHLESKQQ